MSQQLISRSKDLKKLRDEGYDLEIKSNYLIVKNIPYVTKSSEVKFGTIVSELTLAGDVTVKPNTHVIYFAGEYPCNKNGSEIVQIKHSSTTKTLGKGILINHSFSSKPKGGYNDFYEKIATYTLIISNPATSINPEATPRTYPTIEADENGSVFNYIDTASSRAEIGELNKVFHDLKIGIVGLGGTGSYILDLVAKTPVDEIYIYDGDQFLQHNAFRSPGATSLEELQKNNSKANYFSVIYSRMHRKVIANSTYIDNSNINLLQKMNFIFLCLDRSDVKESIIEKLEEWKIPFIDVGMGIQFVEKSLLGILRVTTSTENKREHVKEKSRIAFSENNEKNEYSRNIQIADLNALNAALAVIKWKKYLGFYLDLEKEHYCAYTIDGNNLINEDQLEK